MLHRVHTQNAPTSEIMATTQTFKFSDWHYATVWTHCILKLLISRQNSSSSVGGATFLFVFNHDICHCPVLTTNTSSAFWLSEKKKKKKSRCKMHHFLAPEEFFPGKCWRQRVSGISFLWTVWSILYIPPAFGFQIQQIQIFFYLFFFFFKHSWTF